MYFFILTPPEISKSVQRSPSPPHRQEERDCRRRPN
jgi:hypothetical protein